MIAIALLVLLFVAALILGATGAGHGGLPTNQLAMLVLLFVVFFMSGIYVAAALGILSFLASQFLSSRPAYGFFGQVAWDVSSNFVFVAVPLFILMGELLLRAGLSDKLYRALNIWIGRMPGGLLHTNIATCAVFATVCGSSVATAAMIGSVAIPYFKQTKYNERMVLGSLCGGGALGQLIPPGISLIVYGLFTGTSIGQLYAVAFVVGALVTALCMAFILVYGIISGTRAEAIEITWRDRYHSLFDLLPTFVLIMMVLGSLYLGLATATEAGALGVTGALILAALGRKLNLKMVNDAVTATARTAAMVGLILVGALILNFVLGTLRLPELLAQTVTTLPVAPVVVMLGIMAFYVALGALMEGYSIILTTIPVVFPVVIALHYNAVWWGVLMTMLIEVALISPPDGIILYIIQGLRGRGAGSINDVFVGVLPFLAIYIIVALVMLAVPDVFLYVVRHPLGGV